MENSKSRLVFLTVLIVLFMTSCAIDLDEGTVIITNNSNKDFNGKVWTDIEELFNGRIRAWNTKSFRVSDGSTVYTDFETTNGSKSNPSGRVSRNRTLILDL